MSSYLEFANEAYKPLFWAYLLDTYKIAQICLKIIVYWFVIGSVSFWYFTKLLCCHWNHFFTNKDLFTHGIFLSVTSDDYLFCMGYFLIPSYHSEGCGSWSVSWCPFSDVLVGVHTENDVTSNIGIELPSFSPEQLCQPTSISKVRPVDGNHSHCDQIVHHNP